jgi:peroxiredoxin
MRRTTSVLTIGAAALVLVAGAWATLRAAGQAAPASGVAIGQAAPSFSAKDQNGKDVSLSDFKGKIIVLEWMNPDCPFVQRHYDEKTFVKLDQQYASKGVAHIAINSTDEATAAVDKKFADEHGVKYPILADVHGKIAKAYGAKSTPHLFVIGKDGQLAYKGAIDNDPDGEKKDRINYVAKALDELLAGKPVSTPETKSYGCGVHYDD